MVVVYYYGYISGWEVTVEYISGGRVFQRDIIKPNEPSLRMGFNVNVKDIRGHPEKAVLLQISREPGAVWALAGGIFFMVGVITLIALKIRMER
ncbi:MAG: hypothetical protein HZA14_02915 [Nitrospirae bacterium]|nr:hypothetical protein [Nitrospirota bacterium]